MGWMPLRRKTVLVAVALCLTVVVSTPAVAATNLVSNPDGANASTVGWSMSYNGQDGTLTAVQQNGQWWLRYQSTLQEGGGVWVQYQMHGLTVGDTYTCGFLAMGSGSIYADVYNGSEDVTSPSEALASAPQIFDVTFTLAKTGNDLIQVRYTAPPVDVYFSDVTCAPGSSVVLAAQKTTSVASSSTSSAVRTSSAASAASTSVTKSSTVSTSSPTAKSATKSSIPKTGSGRIGPLTGVLLLMLGAAWLGWWRYRPS